MTKIKKVLVVGYDPIQAYIIEAIVLLSLDQSEFKVSSASVALASQEEAKKVVEFAYPLWANKLADLILVQAQLSESELENKDMIIFVQKSDEEKAKKEFGDKLENLDYCFMLKCDSNCNKSLALQAYKFILNIRSLEPEKEIESVS